MSVAYKEYMHEEQEPNNATEDMPPYPNAGPVASSIPRPPAALVHPPPIVNSPYNIHHQPLPLKETETPSTIPGTQPILISSSPVRTPVNADPSDTKPLVQQELNPIPEEEEKEPSLDSNEQPPKEQPIVIPPTIIEEQEPPKSSPSEPKVDDLDNAIDRIAQNGTEGAIGVHAQPVSESAVPQPRFAAVNGRAGGFQMFRHKTRPPDITSTGRARARSPAEQVKISRSSTKRSA